MRYVELSPRADAGRTSAPIAARAAINRVIRGILANPAWGASPSRFLAPAQSPNSGLIVDLGARGWAVVYRVKTLEDCVWIEDIRRVMLG